MNKLNEIVGQTVEKTNMYFYHRHQKVVANLLGKLWVVISGAVDYIFLVVPCGGERGRRGCIRSCSMQSMQFVKVFCIMHLLLGSGWLEQSFGFVNVGASLQCFPVNKSPSGTAHARSFGLRDPYIFFLCLLAN